MNSSNTHDADRVRGFFSSHPDLLLITDPGGTALDLNDAARRALPPELASGGALAEFVHEQDRAAFEAAWARLDDAQAASTVCRLRGPDGGHATVAMSARRAEGQSWVYVQLSISQRDEGRAPPVEGAAGAAPPSSQEARILRTMLDHMDIVAWAIDARGSYTFQEGRGLAAIGLTPRQQLGMNVFDIYDAETSAPTRRALDGEAVALVVPVDGAIWETSIWPVRDEQGHLDGAVGFSMNVSERERAKAEIEAKIQIIERQRAVIHNLETPVIQVWDRVLTLPMIGIVDSRRAARVMDELLSAVVRGQARFALLDLTGVDVVDTGTANHLIGMIRAIRLLGAEGIITGIRPEVARTIVSLGVDLSSIVTVATLRDGLSMAIRRMAGERAGVAAR